MVPLPPAISLDDTYLSFHELIETDSYNSMSAQDQPQDMSSLAGRIINFGKFNVTSQVLSHFTGPQLIKHNQRLSKHSLSFDPFE